MRRKPFVVAAIAVVLATALMSCGNGSDESQSGGVGTVKVFTAPPLERVVRALAEVHQHENPDAEVAITVLPEEPLIQSLRDGQPDVAIVPRPWLAPLGNDIGDGAFGRNVFVIAVPRGNPARVGLTAFAAGSGRATMACAAAIPQGNFATIMLNQNGIVPDPATVGTACERDVLAKLGAGELDAGLMFRAGLDAPAGVELVEIPDKQNFVIDIDYVVVDADAARSFLEFLDSEAGRRVLTRSGWLP